jgi:hypothetical protein
MASADRDVVVADGVVVDSEFEEPEDRKKRSPRLWERRRLKRNTNSFK